MRISHHLDDTTIVALAAGTLGEATGTVAACHIAWCPTCRAALQRAEAVGGALMEALEPVAVSQRCREAVMMQLDGQPQLREMPLPQRDKQHDPGLPMPLVRLMGGKALDEVEWRRYAPGVAVHEFSLPPGERGRLRLVKMAPGRTAPEHSHEGEELTLILRGAYRDSLGLFNIGDVADLDGSVCHQPKVLPDSPCICLVGADRPLRYTSWTLRLLQPLIRI